MLLTSLTTTTAAVINFCHTSAPQSYAQHDIVTGFLSDIALT